MLDFLKKSSSLTSEASVVCEIKTVSTLEYLYLMNWYNKKKNDGGCIAIGKSGKRCKNEAVSGGYCTVHAKVEQGTVKKQCSKIKSNGERSKMKTKAKSGRCYYHD